MPDDELRSRVLDRLLRSLADAHDQDENFVNADALSTRLSSPTIGGGEQ